jgi:hypothetical protein
MVAALVGPTWLIRERAAQGASIDRARLAVARSPQALSCPDEEQLAALVRRARAEGARSTVGLQLEVEMRPAGGGFEALIHASGARQGERQIQVDGPCENLAQALAVSLALLLDDEGQWLPPVPVSSAPSSGRPAVSSAAPAASLARPPPRTALVLGAGLIRGAPGDAVAPQILAGAQRTGPGWGLLARGAFSWHTYPLSQGEVRVQAAMIPGRGGWVPVDGERRAGLCGRAAVGALRGTGAGHAEDHSVLRPWAGAGPAVVVGSGRDRTGAVEVEAGVWVPLRRETFSIDGIGGISAPAVGIDINLAVALSIW